jgi:hypothetical protein
LRHFDEKTRNFGIKLCHFSEKHQAIKFITI